MLFTGGPSFRPNRTATKLGSNGPCPCECSGQSASVSAAFRDRPSPDDIKALGSSMTRAG
jgi:hypothetical protein